MFMFFPMNHQLEELSRETEFKIDLFEVGIFTKRSALVWCSRACSAVKWPTLYFLCMPTECTPQLRGNQTEQNTSCNAHYSDAGVLRSVCYCNCRSRKAHVRMLGSYSPGAFMWINWLLLDVMFLWKTSIWVINPVAVKCAAAVGSVVDLVNSWKPGKHWKVTTVKQLKSSFV